MKSQQANTPFSIDRASRRLNCDRRTLTAALERSAEIDFIFSADKKGVRGTQRYHLRDACEALELWKVRQAPAPRGGWTQAGADEHARALCLDCPRCGGRHVECPILPLKGKQDAPEILAWYSEHGFTA